MNLSSLDVLCWVDCSKGREIYARMPQGSGFQDLMHGHSRLSTRLLPSSLSSTFTPTARSRRTTPLHVHQLNINFPKQNQGFGLPLMVSDGRGMYPTRSAKACTESSMSFSPHPMQVSTTSTPEMVRPNSSTTPIVAPHGVPFWSAAGNGTWGELLRALCRISQRTHIV